jgi:hypothetical protein
VGSPLNLSTSNTCSISAPGTLLKFSTRNAVQVQHQETLFKFSTRKTLQNETGFGFSPGRKKKPNPVCSFRRLWGRDGSGAAAAAAAGR